MKTAAEREQIVKGRAVKRHAGAARHELLVAARTAFAAKGLAGARADEIARAALLNTQLVYHHFGREDELYRAVLERVYVDIREHERALSLGNLAPGRAMARLVEFSFDYLRAHPEFIALLSDENAHGARHLARRRHVVDFVMAALRPTAAKAHGAHDA
jgi:TetR/AcrR family transcriptional regulator